jgi:hypothetical protein
MRETLLLLRGQRSVLHLAKNVSEHIEEEIGTNLKKTQRGLDCLWPKAIAFDYWAVGRVKKREKRGYGQRFCVGNGGCAGDR